MNKPWLMDSSRAFAIKGVENRKDVKYMDEITKDFKPSKEMSSAPDTMKPFITGQNYDQDKVQVTAVTFRFIERLYHLMKASKAHNADLYIEDNKPLKVLAYDQRKRGNKKGQVDKSDRGQYILAPYEPDNAEKRRERTKTISAL